MNSKLETRFYRPGDEIRILDLFRQSFGRDLAKRFWSWRFRDNPAGPGVINLAWDDNILAAHYAITPVISRIHGCDLLTGLSGTTITHPDYRGRGLFPELARSTYTRMSQLGMVMVWGFPNTLSHRGFVRDLNWMDICEVPMFRLSLIRHLSLPTPSENVVELDGFDDRFDRLWEQVENEYQIMTKRDLKYLRWRYMQNPSERYRILAYIDGDDVLGYIVFKRYHEEFQIVDILIAHEVDVGKQLIFRAAQIAVEESAIAISLWLNVAHLLRPSLEKLGFRNEEPLTYFGGLSLQSKLKQSQIYDFGKWYLNMGDSDVF